jgi:hypothetical protein
MCSAYHARYYLQRQLILKKFLKVFWIPLPEAFPVFLERIPFLLQRNAVRQHYALGYTAQLNRRIPEQDVIYPELPPGDADNGKTPGFTVIPGLSKSFCARTVGDDQLYINRIAQDILCQWISADSEIDETFPQRFCPVERYALDRCIGCGASLRPA